MNSIEVEANSALVVLTIHDLNLLRSALREANEALQDWEFETRMGFTRAEVRVLMDQIHAIEASVARRAE